MEWVEVTAKSLEEAKELALDQLGVDADDAEFEVLEEPRQGLFGRLRGQARVRARVRPTAVRPKRDRRERGRRERKGGESSGGAGRSTGTATVADDEAAEAAPSNSGNSTGGRGPRNEQPRDRGGRNRSEGRNRNGSNDGPRGNGRNSRTDANKEATVDNPTTEHAPVNPDDVGNAAAAFVTGLAEAFGATVTSEVVTEGTDIEVRVNGNDLGLLIGPGGRTLTAVQDLARVAAQRKLGDHDTRLKIDVAGYREKRRVALENFARTVAAEVVASGRAKALEPMSSADRKIVHDALADFEGVASSSSGDEPQRRVVINPA